MYFSYHYFNTQKLFILMSSPNYNSQNKNRVVIVGGGVIGLCVAYYVLRAGKKVVLIEREPEEGDNCSVENAGMVVPSHFVPLAAPGMIALGLRWMLSSESPFAIRLRPSRKLMRWLYLFWRSANKKHVIHNRELLRDLNLKSRELFIELADDGSYELVKRGLLMLCKGPHSLEEESLLASEAGDLGLDVEVCDSRRLSKIDPDIEMDVEGGVWFKEDCHLDPGLFLTQLRKKILGMGAEIQYQVCADGFVLENGQAKALRLIKRDGTGSSNDSIEADQFVIAGGAWSSSLAGDLGLDLPIIAGKGYSMTLPDPVQLPRVCSILNEARVAVTPMGGSLRFAGTMELGDNDLSINDRRVKGILKSIPKYFPQFKSEHFDGVKRWSGLRPCSPDGLPYIGPAGPGADGIFIATGHAMMGLSLGPITGHIMANILCNEHNKLPLDALFPGRFS